MPDPKLVPEYEAINAAQKEYAEWTQWESIIDQGWLALADYTACTWCGTMVYPPLKHLHRTECRGPLDAAVPNPVPVEVVQEFGLDTYLPSEEIAPEI